MSGKYDGSLNLLKTAFKMRGDLPKREPVLYRRWEEIGLYEKIIEKNKNKPDYVLHDGPPYANGKIHLGTALNKVLKDVIVKQKNMSGFRAKYVPGWDTHGLPIELKALKSVKKKRSEITKTELREICRSFAIECAEEQKQQFKSLGVIGDFAKPYLTLDGEYEARQIEMFGKMVEKGYIYKGLKPVYYCCGCATALAESEIEYGNDECCSLYVKFRVEEDGGFFKKIGIDSSKVYFVIWTTTGWTLPANVAVCLGPRYEYAVVKNKSNDEYYVVAKNLVDETLNAAGFNDYEIEEVFSGSCFENIVLKNPILDRQSLVILGNHVTLESGTGCVHTAPGHGIEDFEACRKYNLPIVVVVDEKGLLSEEAGEFSGLEAETCNDVIVEKLKESGGFFAAKTLTHKYPHCWRCGRPVLFRATEQWFCSISGFKDDVLKAIKTVEWIPSWGGLRLENMVKDRSDWCISRQRTWGVPIPVLYCCKCKRPVVDGEVIKIVANLFREFSSDCWYFKESSEFLPEGFCCSNCGGSEFYKEEDIMDVWFDSGCSHAAVLNEWYGLKFPADLYLEGADQYRGWFQSSLLTSIATFKQAPYKAVCTHGWVVDGEGRKMSKSLSNGVAPEKIIEKYGSDVLRLWVVSSDYHADIRISEAILTQLTEGYRKVRNTARFILGNIGDFNPDVDLVGCDDLSEIDRFAIFKLNEFLNVAKVAYDKFEFHALYHAMYNFCVVDLSNFYLDIIKDRLYCDEKSGVSRRAAQTTMFLILDAFTRVIAPILAFTSEEIWENMPHRSADNCESVLLNDMCWEVKLDFDEKFLQKWRKINILRDAVRKVLEIKREDKIIGSSLEANVVLYCKEDDFEFFKDCADSLKAVFLVSGVEVKSDGSGEHSCKELNLSIDVFKFEGTKCERCWSYFKDGEGLKEEALCNRCSAVV